MAPIGIGVVGLGRAFTLMLPAFQGDRRIELAAGFDPRPAACTQFERDFSAPAYASVEQLARDPGVEVVYIASPHQFHAEHACVAAAAGKHVLVEKPMALSLAECDAMIETCAANGVHLIVGHCHSFDAPYLCTRKLVQSGAFGAVRMVHALNYTDFLYRPRRPEELDTAHGGGAVYNQAAHQVDIVRLVAGGRVTRVMAATGRWDAGRPTEGAYSAMMWFDHGAFASITYSGYAHFDSDEWMDWVGEMGHVKDPSIYGAARRRHSTATSPQEESRWKNQSTYGGAAYKAAAQAAALHQHFGPLIVSCDTADLRPMADGVHIYGHESRHTEALDQPSVPRFEVVDELVAVVRDGQPALHDGSWGRTTLGVCLALLESARLQRPVELHA